MSQAERVIVIGWDCASADLLSDEWLHELPNLRRLTQQGIAGPMRSSDPPITVPAWTSMLSSRLS